MKPPTPSRIVFRQQIEFFEDILPEDGPMVDEQEETGGGVCGVELDLKSLAKLVASWLCEDGGVKLADMLEVEALDKLG